jgi:dCTP deaminase
MPIGQLIYFEVSGEVNVAYNKKANAKYTGRSPLPQGSRMWKNF